MDRAVRGLLGGIAGAGKGLADVGRRQSEYRMEELKARTQFDRQKHMASLAAQSEKQRAQMQIDAQKESATAAAEAAREQYTWQKGEEATAKEKAFSDAATSMVDFQMPEGATPEDRQAAIDKAKLYLKVKPLIGESGKLSAEAQSKLVTELGDRWESMEDREKGALVKQHGGDPAKARAAFIKTEADVFKKALVGGEGTPSFFETQVTPLSEKVTTFMSQVKSRGDADKAIAEAKSNNRPEVAAEIERQAELLYPAKPGRTLRPAIKEASAATYEAGKKVAGITPAGLLYRGGQAAVDWLFPVEEQ